MSDKPRKPSGADDDFPRQESFGPRLARCAPRLPENVITSLDEYFASIRRKSHFGFDAETQRYEVKFPDDREIIVCGGKSGSGIICKFPNILPQFASPEFLHSIVEQRVAKIHELAKIGFDYDTEIGHDRELGDKIVMSKPVKTSYQELVLAEIKDVAEILGLLSKKRVRKSRGVKPRNENSSNNLQPKSTPHPKNKRRR